MDAATHDRLEYLRGQIHDECISYSEIAELQSLADEIDPGDVELLEWAGVPEFPEPRAQHTPEPWFVDTSNPDAPFGICQDVENGWGIAEVSTFAPEGTDAANAARIVACVNGCAGIDPAAVGDMLAALVLCEQALSDIIGAADNGEAYTAEELEKHFIGDYNAAHAAIARATGGE